MRLATTAPIIRSPSDKKLAHKINAKLFCLSTIERVDGLTSQNSDAVKALTFEGTWLSFEQKSNPLNLLQQPKLKKSDQTLVREGDLVLF